MKLSNRILGIFLLLLIIGSFYIFYQIFFKIKLTYLEINSNIGSFTGNLNNIKFSREFYCKKRKCIINKIPSFEYKISIKKKEYKVYQNNINLSKINKINIFLYRDIILKKIDKKQLSKREKILKLNNNKLNFGNDIINYNKIIAENYYVYFKKNNNKLYFYNLKNNNSFSILFNPKINYIKKLSQNKFIINSIVGSFIYDILTKKIEYFSLFSDFVLVNNNYIGIINSDDNIRKQNFNLENKSGNFIIYYNIKTKKRFILKNLNNKIDKIYKLDKKIYIEDYIGNKYEFKDF